METAQATAGSKVILRIEREGDIGKQWSYQIIPHAEGSNEIFNGNMKRWGFCAALRNNRLAVQAHKIDGHYVLYEINTYTADERVFGVEDVANADRANSRLLTKIRKEAQQILEISKEYDDFAQKRGTVVTVEEAF